MAKRANGEGSVYQRKSDGKWVGSLSLPDGKRKIFYGKKQAEVIKKLQAALHEFQQGMLVLAPQEPLKTYLERWLEDVHRPAIRVSSYVKYRKLLKNYLIPGLGHIALQKVTPQQVQFFYSSLLKRGLAPKTVKDVHGVLHKALETAVSWNLVARNVCDVVSPPRVPEAETIVLTLPQARALLAQVREHRLEPLLMLALTTAMRRGELLALRWSCINFEERSLQVKRTVDFIPRFGFVETEPKSKKGRRNILLAGFVTEALQAHRLHQAELRQHLGMTWIEKDLVFTNGHGDYFSPNTLLKIFGRILKQTGLPHVRFHDLRHSAATILLAMGVHPKIVQEILGHSQISMTFDRYAHMLPSMQEDVPGKWDEMFRS